jgi:hypothetical protein
VNRHREGDILTAFRAKWVAAGALALVLVTTPTYGDLGESAGNSNPLTANGHENLSQVNSDTMSCKDLKAVLEKAGSLKIFSVQRGWADTFYGPGVPLCQFWERPVFSYVDTTDGFCAVGYICVDKLSPG